ncbi:MAG: hypothetical protein NZ853_10960 [Leptospiraceae bacterium]|nr:hypothetical protein [Leptospiraceae bacterium]MDW7975520.1 hypothetical protein [Leptospiraceae bacterium]
MSKKKVLILGFGFTTKYFIRHFDIDFRVLTRKPEDLKKEWVWTEDFFPDVVIDTIPPVYEENQRLMNPLYKEVLLPLYQQKKFVYTHISSTSVYPEVSMEFHEQTEIPFFSERGIKRWELEEAVLMWFPYALIVRSGGIYGPERNLVKSLKNQEYHLIPTENKVVYRIHVYDLCQILIEFSYQIYDSGIEVSLFSGYQRKNVINAIEPKNEPIQKVLEFIHRTYKIEIPRRNLEPPTTQRKIISLYTKNFSFRFPDFRSGFLDVFPPSYV